MSKIVYLYVKPLFPYYFLLIATMTKAMFVHSQQFLIIILFLCEVITLHKINAISLCNQVRVLSIIKFSVESRALLSCYDLEKIERIKRNKEIILILWKVMASHRKSMMIKKLLRVNKHSFGHRCN